MLLSDLTASAMADDFGDQINAGTPPGHIKFFTGSAPAHTTDADSGTLLATLTFSNTSFGSASAGVATANTITDDSSTPASGTPGYWRFYDAAGTCIAQGTVGTSGADINFNTTTWTSGGIVHISSMTFTMPTS